MSKEEEKPVIVFDAYELDNFESCDFKWDAFHHRNIRPKNVATYFEKGTLLHYFLEHYYKTKIDRKVTQDDLEELIEKSRVYSLKFDLDLETVQNFIFQFREYARYYEDENIIPLHVEEPFLKKIHEDDDIILYLQGIPDLVFKYPGNSIAIMDHKRVDREFDINSLRNQFQIYALALEVDTVIVNKVGFQKTKRVQDRFLRNPLVYNQEILNEFKEKLIYRAKQMLIALESKHFPRNHSSCDKFGGCYLQHFCQTRPKAREFLIGTEYLIGESWDATKKLE